MITRFQIVARATFVSLALLALTVPSAQAAPDAAATQAADKLVQTVCVTCHGAEGRGDNPRIPRLAGQQRAYLEIQLKAFRGQSRKDPAAHEYMWAVASTLNDSVIAALADYFSAQAPVASTPPTDAKMAAVGRQLFEHGSPERGIPACAGCHGQNAEGMGVFPRLAGQHSQYLYIQLKLVQNQLRDSPVMHGLIKQLSGDEVTAVTTYLQAK